MAKVLIPALAGGTALALVGTVALATALRTNDVELTVDGASSALSVRERTVGEVLEAQGVELGAHDAVLPAADTRVTPLAPTVVLTPAGTGVGEYGL